MWISANSHPLFTNMSQFRRFAGLKKSVKYSLCTLAILVLEELLYVIKYSRKGDPARRKRGSLTFLKCNFSLTVCAEKSFLFGRYLSMIIFKASIPFFRLNKCCFYTMYFVLRLLWRVLERPVLSRMRMTS